MPDSYAALHGVIGQLAGNDVTSDDTPLRVDASDWDSEVDVLVVGAGGCGLTAALAAHGEGASVAVVEKSDRVGGNTALSTGSIPGAGSRFQQLAGIEDSPTRMVEDLLRQSGPHDAAELVTILAEASAGLVEWLVDDHGVDLRLITDYRHVGHSVPRLHAPPSRRGSDLVADLLAAVERCAIPLVLGNPVRRLVIDGQGAVCGAVIGGDRVTEYRLRAAKVVLAANGFGADRVMVGRHCPGIAGAEYFGAVTSTGEAIRWGEALGAGVGNMGAYQGYAAVAYPHGTILSWTIVEKGGVICNGIGERFGDETVGYSGFAEEVLAQDAPVVAVFDTRIRDYVASHEVEFRELVRGGGVRVEATPEALAEAFGLPGDTLAATIEAYRAAATGGVDPFGRSDFSLAPLQPPYAGCRVVPGLFHTQGGVQVDGEGRVRRPDGSLVRNLYAGGGVAAGLSGRSGGRGYCSGNGLLAALGLGRLAGRAAAREVAATDERS